MLSEYTPKIQTVTELTGSLKGLLENSFPFVTVVGEISNLRRPHSGHLYFTLKDQAAQIKAVIFKLQQRYLAGTPKDGMEVICKGRVSVYEPRGEYQLIIDALESRGAGNLQIAFDNLKKQLAMEGLFDQAAKKKLPFFPGKITLITSPKGAAVFDFLKIAGARCPSIPIEIFPVRVQGESAADDIAEALKSINEQGQTEVIVLCRGGGSLEDLWPFNEEKVARAIFAAKIPVTSAVGHETDFTIADFVADLRAPTPSAAAEMIIPDRRTLREKISHLTQSLARSFSGSIDSYDRKIERHRHALISFAGVITRDLLLADAAETRLVHGAEKCLQQKKDRLEKAIRRLEKENPAHLLIYRKQLAAKSTQQLATMMQIYLKRRQAELQKNTLILDAVSPLAILARGYAIVKSGKTGEIIRESRQVSRGEKLEIVLHKGRINSKVT